MTINSNYHGYNIVTESDMEDVIEKLEQERDRMRKAIKSAGDEIRGDCYWKAKEILDEALAQPEEKV